MTHQDRKRNIVFINQRTNKSFVMDPRDIALAGDLISEFDSLQAFSIGLSAGLKMCHQITGNNDRSSASTRPPLRLIDGGLDD